MLDIFNRAMRAYATAYRANPLEHFRESDVLCHLVAELRRRISWKIALTLDQGVQWDLYKFRDTDLLACPVLTHVGIHGEHPNRTLDLCLLDGETATIMPRTDGAISSIAPPVALAVEVLISHGGSGGSRIAALEKDRDKLLKLLDAGKMRNAAVVFVDHRCKRFLKRNAEQYEALFSGSGVAFHHVSRFGYERDFTPMEN